MEYIRYKIYQMKSGCKGKFMPYCLCKAEGYANMENYEEVCHGILLPHEVAGKKIEEILSELFVKYNTDDRPHFKNMHSLSVSDMIELDGIIYYCDLFCWIKINKLK